MVLFSKQTFHYGKLLNYAGVSRYHKNSPWWHRNCPSNMKFGCECLLDSRIFDCIFHVKQDDCNEYSVFIRFCHVSIIIYDEMNILCCTTYRNEKICMIYIFISVGILLSKQIGFRIIFSFHLKQNVSTLIKHCFPFLFIVFSSSFNFTLLCNSKFRTIS